MPNLVTKGAPRKLWTPNGEHNIDPNIERISQQELRMLSMLHEFAQRHGLTILCDTCGSSLQGRNQSPTQTTFIVACGCKEYVFTKA